MYQVCARGEQRCAIVCVYIVYCLRIVAIVCVGGTRIGRQTFGTYFLYDFDTALGGGPGLNA